MVAYARVKPRRASAFDRLRNLLVLAEPLYKIA